MTFLPIPASRRQFLQATIVALTIATMLLASNACLAAKGDNGNGGGKPGGGDPPPPEPPVSLTVTPIAIPGLSASLYGFNEQRALVGSLFDAPPGGRRGLAYLPGITSNAVFLDDVDFGLQKDGELAQWHTRSAVDINIHGTIVGNIERDDLPPNTYVRPMYITGATTGAPTLHTLDALNPNAWHEAAAGVNDSGDMLVWSQERRADGSEVDSLYVGNPGLHDQPAAPFVQIDFALAGIPAQSIQNANIHITNRRADSTATVAGRLSDGETTYTFRVNHDGTGLQIAPDYVAEDGTSLAWVGGSDVNSSGDVAGAAFADPAKKGKVKSTRYGAVWEFGSNEILPAIGGSPFETAWQNAVHNDHKDVLLKGGSEPALWHGDWSETNGPLDVASLIDPSDPNASLFNGSVFDLTNRDASDWPTVIAQGSEVVDDVTHPYWLLLTPELTSVTQFAGATAVPEPASALLAVLAVTPLLLLRRSSWRVVSVAS